MFSSNYYLTLPILACLAFALDSILGEPKRFHPLIGFGWLASQFENKLNPTTHHAKWIQRLTGLIVLLLLVAPFAILVYAFCQQPTIGFMVETLFLYLAIGHKSLRQHALAVREALKTNNTEAAKKAASHMVSRDLAAIAPIASTIESVLENGNDSVFGALFWFFVAGGTGALIFRLVNTLDAMWGYKTTRFYYFGWAAARLDDVMNYIPARLTAITYALHGKTRIALKCWQQQSPLWDSPNAGPVMAAGAGALQITLGGAARYHGEWHQRPTLGAGEPPVSQDILRALTLVKHGAIGWLIAMLLAATLAGVFYA